MNQQTNSRTSVIRGENLTLAYGKSVILQNLSFQVDRGDIFVIMGGSGCGKSTLLRHLIGLHEPAAGKIFHGAVSFWELPEQERTSMLCHMGILYQNGALWTSMTLAENIALPLETYTHLKTPDIRELVSLKLELVGLAGCERYYPSEISGGMRKRAALARAIALDPELLFFDEPSAGLDPISAYQLDELILQLRENLGATVIIVSHELSSIFAVGTRGILLDAETKTIIATGNPRELRDHSDDPRVKRFLTRGASE